MPMYHDNMPHGEGHMGSSKPPQPGMPPVGGGVDFQGATPESLMSAIAAIARQPQGGLGGHHDSRGGLGSELMSSFDSFRDLMPIPKHATNTVYVEGVPYGTTKREVARKLSYR